MGIVSVRLLKDWEGVPAGTFIQVHEYKHKQLQEIGVCADPDEELAALKKKSKKNQDASDVNE